MGRKAISVRPLDLDGCWLEDISFGDSFVDPLRLQVGSGEVGGLMFEGLVPARRSELLMLSAIPHHTPAPVLRAGCRAF